MNKPIFPNIYTHNMDDYKMRIKVKKLHPDAIIPKYATDGSSGFDLHALRILLLDQVKLRLLKLDLFWLLKRAMRFKLDQDLACL